APAKSLNVSLQQFEARGPDDFPDTFATMAKSGSEAVVILEDAVFVSNARAIADLATKQRLPSVGFTEYAEAPGLIGYVIDFIDMDRCGGGFLGPEWQTETPVVCAAGRGPLDEAVAVMLAQVLDKHGLHARVEGVEAIASTSIFHLETKGVAMVCVSYLDTS